MKINKFTKSLLLSILAIVSIQHINAQTDTCEILVDGLNIREWYKNKTGYTPDPTHFGAYALVALGDTLYIGFGTAYAELSDGAILAGYDGNTLDSISVLSEQGFRDMSKANGSLYIPGADPCCPEGWGDGNYYIFSPPDQFIKHRNQTDVIHGLGTWIENDTIYLATGSHTGDFVTPVGKILRSTDNGNSWNVLSEPSNF
ncbi:hypothetical protein JYT51_02455, partial [Candidatus Amoebophilus asiaticus]|nr:hypothetical protein [Candidatus Amoebophilus asiaticus]